MKPPKSEGGAKSPGGGVLGKKRDERHVTPEPEDPAREKHLERLFTKPPAVLHLQRCFPFLPIKVPD